MPRWRKSMPCVAPIHCALIYSGTQIEQRRRTRSCGGLSGFPAQPQVRCGHKALKTQGQAPLRTTFNDYPASHRAIREMPIEEMGWKDTKLRSSKYLNNLIEQDHRI